MAIAATAATLLVPTTALGWGEVATRAVPGGGPATCLRSAGTGVLSMLGPLGKRTAPFDLIAASNDRLRPIGRARFGVVASCADAAVNDAGAAAVVGADYPRFSGRARVRVAYRDPGAQLKRVLLQVAPDGLASDPTVAVGPAGDMAAAWTTFTHIGRHREPDRAALFVARRSPGGSFGKPRRVDRWRLSEDLITGVPAIGLDAAGRLTLVWVHGRPVRRDPEIASVETASAARGGPPVRGRRLAKTVGLPTGVALAVNPSGDALAAFANFDLLGVFERSGGGFVRRRVRTPAFVEMSEPTVAEAPDGSAVVAWRTNAIEVGAGGVSAVRRHGHGRFSRPQRVSPTPRDRGSSFGGSVGFGGDEANAPDDPAGLAVRAAMTPAGRAILTWIAPHTVGRERNVPAAYASIAGRRGHFGRRRAFGSPCRPPNGAAPVRLKSGRLGAAWTDTIMNQLDFEFGVPLRDGRLHVAFPDAPKRPSPPPPRIRVRAPRSVALYSSQGLPVRIHCDRACDLRASVAIGHHAPRGVAIATLRRRGTKTLRIGSLVYPPLVPRHGGRLRLTVHACPAGGPRLRTAKRVVIAHRLPAPPLAVPLGLTARRHGHRIVVRWHTAIPARRVEYIVYATKRRHPRGFVTVAEERRGRGRHRFRVVLRNSKGLPLRWAHIEAYQDDAPDREARATTRIR